VLNRLVDAKTVLVIEHDLDAIKTADWIIDLGPEGGSAGGEISATGTPEDVAKIECSHTGRVVRPLSRDPAFHCVTAARAPPDRAACSRRPPSPRCARRSRSQRARPRCYARCSSPS
jgi:hypothetical protein